MFSNSHNAKSSEAGRQPLLGNRATRDKYPSFILVLVLISAAILRAGWAVLQTRRGYTHAAGEAYNVALAISNGRGVSDAYYVGQGATAHVTPFTPALAGAVYRALGNSDLAAEATLAGLAIALVIAAYWLWYRSFAYLDVPYKIRLLGLLILALSPLYITLEAVDFRVWDGALVSLTSAGLFTLILKADQTGTAGTTEICSIASLLALLLFLNPNLGIAGGFASCVLMLRRYSLRKAVSLVVVSGLLLLAITTPWAMRNYYALGAFVPLRSNAGLELAIANYDGATNAKDPAMMYKTRLAAIHPYTSPTAAEKMKASGGEVRYFRILGHQASNWIAAHPLQFAQLYALHISQFFFPRQWQFGLFGGGAAQSLIRSILSALLSTGAFLSLVAGYRRRDVRWLYPAIFLLVPVITYGVFQPVPRYTYLLYGITAFMAADGYYRLLNVIANRAQRGGSEAWRVD